MQDPATENAREQGDQPEESKDSHLSLGSIISLEVPSVKVVLDAQRSALSREKGVFDEHDAGLFKSHESTLDSWKLIVDTKNWKIEQIRRADDSDLRVSLEQFSAIEENSKG